MCFEAPAMIAEYIFTYAIDLRKFGDKMKVRKHRLSPLLCADEETTACRGEDRS